MRLDCGWSLQPEEHDQGHWRLLEHCIVVLGHLAMIPQMVRENSEVSIIYPEIITIDSIDHHLDYHCISSCDRLSANCSCRDLLVHQSVQLHLASFLLSMNFFRPTSDVQDGTLVLFRMGQHVAMWFVFIRWWKTRIIYVENIVYKGQSPNQHKGLLGITNRYIRPY